MLGAILFIIALFTAYAVTALILTYRNIKADEQALDEQAYGDCVFVHPEMFGAAARKDTGGVGAASSSGPVSGDVRTHRGGIQ